MNSKLLIALPILALLSIGAVFMIAHHNKSSAEGAAEEAANALTIDSWQNCFQKLPVKICDQLTNQDELSACYAASYANSQLVWDGAADELSACSNYYTYFKASEAGDVLNFDNFYRECFLNTEAVNAAKKSNFFYTQIYQPKFITCAGY